MPWGRNRKSIRIIPFLLLFVAAAASAQSTKSAKQSESLEKAGASAKSAVEGALTSFGQLLTGYNAIINGEAKDTQKAYKSLVNDLQGTEKKLEGTKKELAALQKEADKFFTAWEKDLEAMSGEGMREKSAKRLEIARQRYADLGDTLSKAGAEFAPLMKNLKDQVLYLGRDLSPEAIAELKDDADALNRQADEAKTRVQEIIRTAGKAEAEGNAEIDAGE